MLSHFKAAHVYFAVSVAGDNADFIVGAADNAHVNGVGRNELAAVHNAACLQCFGGKIFRFAGHGACQLVQLGNGISQLMNGVGAALRSVAVVPAFAGNGNFVFGVAFALGYNAPVRARNVHNNGKICLLRKLCHNAFGSRAAAFFFGVGVVNNFFIIVKACFF